jgi:hypothetical protein
VDWKKVNLLPRWEFECPDNGVAGKEVKFRHPANNADVLEITRFLRTLYKVNISDNPKTEVDGTKVYVTVTGLSGRNIGLLAEDLPWDPVLDWLEEKEQEEETSEAELLRKVALKVFNIESWSSLGDLQTQLIEYQQLLVLAGFLKYASGKLDKETWEAHEKFLKIGLNKVLGLSDEMDIASGDPERKWVVFWIQGSLAVPPTAIYDLDTWLAVKKANSLTIVPVSGTPAESLIEKLIPWTALGITDEEDKKSLTEYLSERARAYTLGDSAEEIPGIILLAAEHALDEGFRAREKARYLAEIDEFNRWVEEKQREEEIRRRSEELFKKVLSNPIAAADESILGKTITSIIYALKPQTPEELLLDFALGLLSGAASGLIKVARQSAKIRRASFAAFQRKTSRLLEVAKKEGFPVGRVAQGRAGELAARWELSHTYGYRTVRSGQYWQGSAKKGFDMFAVRGKGKSARLALCPTQNLGEAKAVVTRKLSELGLGPGGRTNFLQNAAELENRIKSLAKVEIDEETCQALLRQLKDEMFDIFVCVRDKSQVGEKVLDAIRQAFPRAGKVDVLTYGSVLPPK